MIFDKRESGQSVSPSRSEIADALACSFEIESLVGETEQYREMCRIIADVFATHPDCLMHVAGKTMTTKEVQDMYRNLTGAHLEMVAIEVNSQTEHIKNPYAYLRTSLFNAPMKLTTYYTNQVNADFGG